MKTRWVKRVLSMALVCMLLLSLATPALAVGGSETLADWGDTYYVVANRLNVRRGPGTGYSVKAVISKGKKVSFRNERNGWWYVRYGDGKYGYVDKQYLTRSNVRTTGTYRTTARLSVRSYPTTWSYRYGVLKKGARVRVLQLNGDWCRINYDGWRGWIAAKYLRKA